ncbi:MAG: hypothetical protein R3352_05830 [Salinisphaeraceae bacterium]|nr:hypothetical protein [Salinisphaeraceae bacterium]
MKMFEAYKRAKEFVKLEKLEKANQKLMAKRAAIKAKQKAIQDEYEKQLKIVEKLR